MRSILFFDLPTISTSEQKAYRKFIKGIKSLGFYMLQESVYVKMFINSNAQNFILNKVKEITPKKGSVIILNVTEKQFSNMKIICGELITDVVSDDKRTLVL